MGTFSETAIIDYRSSLPAKENKLPFPFASNKGKFPFPFSVFRKQTEVAVFR
jgi:hypothetical protein